MPTKKILFPTIFLTIASITASDGAGAQKRGLDPITTEVSDAKKRPAEDKPFSPELQRALDCLSCSPTAQNPLDAKVSRLFSAAIRRDLLPRSALFNMMRNLFGDDKLAELTNKANEAAYQRLTQSPNGIPTLQSPGSGAAPAAMARALQQAGPAAQQLPQRPTNGQTIPALVTTSARPGASPTSVVREYTDTEISAILSYDPLFKALHEVGGLRLKCLECQTFFPNIPALKAHLTSQIKYMTGPKHKAFRNLPIIKDISPNHFDELDKIINQVNAATKP